MKLYIKVFKYDNITITIEQGQIDCNIAFSSGIFMVKESNKSNKSSYTV